ncbi:MAG: hypothetical protein KIS85_00980 [Anaerolineales bacterium]|nr:hypothetical protein [Anaerolineales bacterium]
MNKTSLLILIALTLLAACAPREPEPAAANGPLSWFDAPLPGVYGLETVELVSHHSDSGGIAELEFSVNGEVTERSAVSDSSSLVIDTRPWMPPDAGEYTLGVRARNHAGQWGQFAETYVVIPPSASIVQGVVYADANGNGLIETGEDPLDDVDVHLDGCGASQVQTTAADGAFNFSGLPAGSCTLQVFKAGWGFSGSAPSVGYPVPVASDPYLPTALGIYLAPMADAAAGEDEASFSEKTLSSDTVYTGICIPNEIGFQVRAAHPDGLRGVTLYFHLEQNGQRTEWSSGHSMTPLGDGYYRLMVTGDHLEDDSGFTQANVVYQFVIEPASGQAADLVRSAIYRDLRLLACDQQAPAQQPTPQPTPTPRR